MEEIGELIEFIGAVFILVLALVLLAMIVVSLLGAILQDQIPLIIILAVFIICIYD